LVKIGLSSGMRAFPDAGRDRLQGKGPMRSAARAEDKCQERREGRSFRHLVNHNKYSKYRSSLRRFKRGVSGVSCQGKETLAWLGLASFSKPVALSSSTSWLCHRKI